MSFVVFSFIHLAPGRRDAAHGRTPGRRATLAALRLRYHLDQPFFVQYFDWLRGAVRGDFGESFAYKDTVSSVVGGRIAPTLELAGFATVIVLVAGVPFGVLAAVRRNTIVDSIVSLVALVLSSAAAYVSGILLIIVFATWLTWFPVFGLGTGPTRPPVPLDAAGVRARRSALTALVMRVTRASIATADL